MVTAENALKEVCVLRINPSVRSSSAAGCLGQHGLFRYANTTDLHELSPNIHKGDYVLWLRRNENKEAAIAIRRFVDTKYFKLVWTNSETIKQALHVPNQASLTWCVQRFREDRKNLWQTYWTAMGACGVASDSFFSFLQTMKIVTQEQVHNKMAGVYRGPWEPGMHPFSGYHAFIFIGRIVIDWTYRQFDENCKFPFIYRLPENQKFPQPYVDYDPSLYWAWNPIIALD